MARMPFGRHRPRPRPGGGALNGVVIAISPRTALAGDTVSITLSVQPGSSITAVSATFNGAPVVLTGSGSSFTYAPTGKGTLVVNATGLDAKGKPIKGSARSSVIYPGLIAEFGAGQIAVTNFATLDVPDVVFGVERITINA